MNILLHRVGRPRTCARVEARAIAGAGQAVCRARQSGHRRATRELVALDAADHRAVIDFCRRHAIGLVVIGPEAPLVDGLADNLRDDGACSSSAPTGMPAQLEGSKGFTKDLCAALRHPDRALSPAHRTGSPPRPALDDFALPVVIKADGLAAGKGVIIAETQRRGARPRSTTCSAAASARPAAAVVIEEFMNGEEASFFALTDGETVLPFGSAQDHKRVGDGDTGPNTGGMGAYSPALVLTPELEARVMDEIVRPTVAAMAASGHALFGHALCRADADRRRPEADRI